LAFAIIRTRKKPAGLKPGQGKFLVLFTYSKKIFLVMAALSVAAGLLSLKLQAYPTAFATGVVVFMALNAIGALYPLYHFKGKKNPFNIYLMGMVVRLGLVGLGLILVITLGGLDKAALLSITLTGMVSFIAYLMVEIHHFIHHNASLMST
jgi:hypothetical protein